MCALHNLMIDAYNEMSGIEFQMQKVPFEQWKANCEENHLLFQFWSLITKLETNYRIFMRSHREVNFQLYKKALAEWVKWTHALDRTNYRRWLPIHLRDLVQLESRHPALHQAFAEGFFVASRTSARFSAMGLDQVHRSSVPPNSFVKFSSRSNSHTRFFCFTSVASCSLCFLMEFI